MLNALEYSDKSRLYFEGSENVDTRLEGGLYEFKQPSETYTMGKLNIPADKTPKKKSLDTIE